MAQTASANDRAVLLQIAEAWEEQAKYAQRSSERKGDGQDGGSLVPDGQ